MFPDLFPEFNHPDLDLATGSNIENVVLFHFPCADGITAAMIALEYLGASHTFLWPYNYHLPAWEEGMFKEGLEPFKGKNVYIVDFSLPPNLLERLAEVAAVVVVCDHHRSFRERMAEDWVGYDEFAYPPVDVCDDSKRGWEHLKRTHIVGHRENSVIWFHDAQCGAEVTYYFFRSSYQGHPFSTNPNIALFMDYTGDRDLWRWTLPKSKEWHAYLGTFTMDLQNWEQLPNIMAVPADSPDCKWVASGSAVLAYENRVTNTICRRAKLIDYQGAKVPVVNATTCVSEIGHRLLELYPDAPFSATFQDFCDGTRKWSLRGRREDNFDTSEVSRTFGGGGHAKASGFQTAVDVISLGS